MNINEAVIVNDWLKSKAIAILGLSLTDFTSCYNLCLDMAIFFLCTAAKQNMVD